MNIFKKSHIRDFYSRYIIICLLLLVIFVSYSSAKEEDSLKFLEPFGIDWKLTIDSMEKGIEKNPNDINLKFVLGSLYLRFFFEKESGFNINLLNKAEKQFKEIIEIKKDDSRTYLYLANIAMLNGANTEQAITFYKQAIQYDKKNVKAYNLINIVLLMERRFKDAIDILEEAKRNNPNEVGILYNLTLNYLSIADTDNAIATAQKSIEIEPSTSNLFILGVAYIQKKELKKAIEMLRKALLLTPENKNSLIALAGALYEDNQYQEALKIIHEAAKLYPEDNMIKDKLKEYEKMGGK